MKIKLKKQEALFEVIILILSIVAFSYVIGSSVKEVSAIGGCTKNTDCSAHCSNTRLISDGRCIKGNCYYGSSIDCKEIGPNYICSNGLCIENTQPIDKTQVPKVQPQQNQKKAPPSVPLPTNVGSMVVNQGVGIGIREAYKWVNGKLTKVPIENPSLFAPGSAATKTGAGKTVGAGETAGVAAGGAKLGSLFWNIVGNAVVAASLYEGIHYLGTFVAKGDANIQRGFNNAAAWASGSYFIGSTASKIALKIAAKKFLTQELGKEATKQAVIAAIKQGSIQGLSKVLAFMALPGFGWALAGAGILISLALFKNKRAQAVIYSCQLWQAPVKGEDCETCNNQGLLPCTEYQCKSLGQACKLVNKGTDRQKCVWSSRNDHEYPIIKPWTDALLSEDYKYTPDNSISPPDRGVYVKYKKSRDGCAPAFTPLSFGVTLNEPAKCKFSTTREKTFEDMGNAFIDPWSDYNHSIALSLPGPDALESQNITVQNGGSYEVYVRCVDENGNSNPANFVFKYCIDKGPDVTNPMIVSTSILNGWPIAYGTNSTDLSVYVNEPAECRWSHLDQSYENMKNQMQCSTKLTDINSYMLYTCKTTLDGLKNKEENKFYFRCKDQPELAGTSRESDRNTNTESYVFSLIGTQPLVLDSVSPNNTIIKGASSPIKVTLTAETSAGYKNGDSICYYKPVGAGNYIEFYNTSSYTHSQDLWLPEGNYSYSIKCVDLGGNKDEKIINFRVETDTTPPAIVRAYHSDAYLELITDEEATCVYNTAANVGCNYNFDEGKPMTDLDKTEHYTEWNSNVNFYVKCKDKGGMEPGPDQCSMIIRPFEI